MTAPSLASYSNGISQVSGDGLNTFSQWCVTAAQLRGFNPNPAVPNLTVYLQGYSAPGDGGQGFFYWNSTGTAPDDNGLTTIKPNGSTAGEWTRIPEGGSGSPGGNNTDVQFNDNGAFGGSDSFTFNKSTGRVALGSLSSILRSTIQGGQYMGAGSYESIMYDNGNSGTSKTIAFENGNLQKVTVTGAVTFSFTAPSYPGRFTLIMIQDGTGHAITLPAIKWPGGVQPTWSNTANAIDIFTIIWDGSVYYGIGNTAFA